MDRSRLATGHGGAAALLTVGTGRWPSRAWLEWLESIAVPAGFLTFASFPLYSTYELAHRVGGLAAATDQQLAGLIMKLGGIPIVWGTIIVMMMRWTEQERRGSAEARLAERGVSS